MSNIGAKIAGQIWKRSPDPKHPDNAFDSDWQAGYFIGCQSESDSGLKDVKAEWERRGKPVQPDDSKPNKKREAFRSWKAGYWAGKLGRLTKGKNHET